jgi:acyl-CoA thioesterase I
MKQAGQRSDAVVLDCGQCGQKLRIPLGRLENVVCCPRCLTRFEVVRTDRGPPSDVQTDPAPAEISRRQMITFGACALAAACGIGAIVYFLIDEDERGHGAPMLTKEPKSGQASTGPDEERDPDFWSEYSTLRVACIGDDITYGSGLAERETMCYPAVLQKLLGQRYEVKNFASEGRAVLSKADFPYVQEDVYREALDYRPHIVVIMLGASDARQQNWAYADHFVNDFKRLIFAIQSPSLKTRIYLCTPTPVWPEGGLDDKRVSEEVVPKIIQVGRDMRLRIIDLQAPFRDRNELFPDDLHPNEVGAKEIADLIAQAIKSAAR